MTLLISLCKSSVGDAVQGDVCHVEGIGKPTASLRFVSVKKALQALTEADVPANEVNNAEHRLLNGREWQYKHECNREDFDALMRDQARTEATDVIRQVFEGLRLLGNKKPPADEWN